VEQTDVILYKQLDGHFVGLQNAFEVSLAMLKNLIFGCSLRSFQLLPHQSTIIYRFTQSRAHFFVLVRSSIVYDDSWLVICAVKLLR